MQSDSQDQTRAEQKQARILRRLALVGLLSLCGLAFWFAAPRVERMPLVGDFEFSDLEQPAGFRQISTGRVSGASDPLTGVGGAWDETNSAAVDLEGRKLCLVLFGAEPGQRSRAKRQDAYATFHQRLMRTFFVTTAAYLRSISDEIGIDADRLLDDMKKSGRSSRPFGPASWSRPLSGGQNAECQGVIATAANSADATSVRRQPVGSANDGQRNQRGTAPLHFGSEREQH